VLESALDQLQKRNSELLTELEHRTQWEAVRLSTALRERDAAFTSHKAQIIQEAMHKTSEHYENVLKRQTAKLEGEMQLKLATTKTELEAQAQAAVASAVQKEREAARLNEEEVAESLTIRLTQRSAAESSTRIEELRNMQLEIQALSQVVADDAHYKHMSHQVHRVSKAVLSITNQLSSNDPFAGAMSDLEQIALEDPVIAAALSYIPPAAPKRGVMTYAQLQDAFGQLAPETRRAALMPEDAGPIWIPLAYMFDTIKFKPKGQVSGDSCEEILARAEDSLNSGNLAAAVKEVELLKGLPEKVMLDWHGAAIERLRVDQAISVVKAHAACLVDQVAS
jgi:hypothetical protein